MNPGLHILFIFLLPHVASKIAFLSSVKEEKELLHLLLSWEKPGMKPKNKNFLGWPIVSLSSFCQVCPHVGSTLHEADRHCHWLLQVLRASLQRLSKNQEPESKWGWVWHQVFGPSSLNRFLFHQYLCLHNGTYLMNTLHPCSYCLHFGFSTSCMEFSSRLWTSCWPYPVYPCLPFQLHLMSIPALHHVLPPHVLHPIWSPSRMTSEKAFPKLYKVSFPYVTSPWLFLTASSLALYFTLYYRLNCTHTYVGIPLKNSKYIQRGWLHTFYKDIFCGRGGLQSKPFSSYLVS